MARLGLMIMIFVFNLAVLISLSSIGHQIYHKVLQNKDMKAATKAAVVILLTICSFLIALFVLDIANKLMLLF